MIKPNALLGSYLVISVVGGCSLGVGEMSLTPQKGGEAANLGGRASVNAGGAPMATAGSSGRTNGTAATAGSIARTSGTAGAALPQGGNSSSGAPFAGAGGATSGAATTFGGTSAIGSAGRSNFGGAFTGGSPTGTGSNAGGGTSVGAAGAAATGGNAGGATSVGAAGLAASGGKATGGAATGGATCTSGTRCVDACVHLDTDENNCGTCGHGCRFAASSCIGGKCQPVALASEQAAPAHIALDNAYVYWSNTGVTQALMRTAKDGSMPAASPTLLAGTYNPSCFALVGPQVVQWGENPPLSGGNATVRYLVHNPMGYPKEAGISFVDGYINGMTSGGTATAAQMYITVTLASGVGAILYAAPTTGATTTLCGPGTSCSTTNAGELAVDATHVYWTEAGPMPNSGRILKLPLTGGTPTPLATGVNFPTHIAVYGGYVYYPNGYGMTKVAADGITAPVPITTSNGVGAVAADASGVYWTDVNSSVWALRAGTTTPVAIATDQASPYYIAIDATTVYWTNQGNSTAAVGSVMAVVK